MEIFLGSECNNNCRFCCAKDFISEPFNRILEKIKKAGKINFTGGEPTLKKRLPELIEYAGEKEVEITTNGRMFSYDKFTKKIVESGLDRAIVSVHGHKSSLHDYLTRSEGSFEQTKKGLKKLKEFVPVQANVLVNTVNYRSLPKITEMVVGEGVESVCFIYPVLGGNIFNYLWFFPDFGDIENVLNDSIKVAKRNGVRAEVLNVPRCFLDDNEINAAEKKYPMIEEKKFVKTNGCRRCIYFERCPGVSQVYVNLKGEKVRPVEKNGM